ncbi:unnamed protein product [Cuscuta epithymum]|uniref:NAC domain-containing protein n=1 Tax=Cuscuta epithymum TaxID=186058 RepID=A0AAV0EMZ7_9ASTE|nr:unnamed protein product [Cuscuta epithymum]
MDAKNERKAAGEESVLPGFRFHPTDEELVGFYLRRKIQQKPLSIELIKQLDIYKFDPWDLPTELAGGGEKEWYFYCPRDRKYRNSARPNRVTKAGFWKATGTDRPIYSSDNSKCIGLKKSLVFYKGRAARGSKTDWMMHEFRMPSSPENHHLPTHKRVFEKVIPPSDAWAICRIFKKASSNVHRALSHQSWVVSSPIPQTPFQEVLTLDTHNNTHAHTNNSTCSTLQFHCTNGFKFSPDIAATPQPLDLLRPFNNASPSYNAFPSTLFAHHQTPLPTNSIANDASSFLLEMSSSVFGDCGGGLVTNGFPVAPPPENLTEGSQKGGGKTVVDGNEPPDIIDDSIRFSFNGFPLSMGSDTNACKSSVVWESSPCPSEISSSYSTNTSATLEHLL